MRNLNGRDTLIRVALWMPRIGRVSGGHKVQLEETAKALWPYDVETRIVWDSEIELGGVDLVHGFGLNPAEVHSCRSSGLPVVISPIYWDCLLYTRCV